LVNKVVPKAALMDTARAWADQIAASAPLAMQTVKEVERAIQALPVDQQQKAMEE
jgi:crotonobetainyl-CoA hydratase